MLMLRDEQKEKDLWGLLKHGDLKVRVRVTVPHKFKDIQEVLETTKILEECGKGKKWQED